MIDPRIKKLAKVLVDYSVFVKKGEHVIISADTNAQDLVKEIYKLVLKKGAYPSLHIDLPGLTYFYYKNATMEQLKKFPKIRWYEVQHTKKYIGIGSPENTRELTNIDPKRIALRDRVVDKIRDYIVNAKPKIHRVTTAFPTNALAQDAEMSLEEYEDFFFNACLLDWNKLGKKIKKIRDVFNKGKVLRIIGEDTDLTLKLHPKSFVAADGCENMPDGEVFGAPQKFSANGHIKFTYPAIHSGVEVTNIYCEFKKGKCIKATAEKNQNFLIKMLNTDKGSRYLGEIGLGMNPNITRFTKSLLFDEKIGGTIHLAFGMAYKECGATNKSALHWDIVKDLKKGGKIILDDKIVQQNGKWKI